MSIKYSPSANAFYDTDINTVIPVDAIDISKEQHSALLSAQSAGQQIYPQQDGTPSTRDVINDVTWDIVRGERDALLAASDWTDLPNTPLTNKQAWLDYRQALRNIPQHYLEPSLVVWPVKP
jgi:hypothetical protein